MSKFKIGDKVKVTQTSQFLDAEIGTVRNIGCHVFGVEFEKYHAGMHTLGGTCKEGHGWWVKENNIELAEPIVPTLAEIKNNHLDCLIHTKTQEEANTLCRMVEYRSDRKANGWWIYNKEKTVYRIACGKIASYSDINFYQTDSHYAKLPMYEFEDIFKDILNEYELVIPKIDIDLIVDKDKYASDFAERVSEKLSTMGCRTFMIDKKTLENIKNKENETMRNTFTFTKSERTAIVVDTIEHKDSKNKTILEKKTREVKIPTIKTTAYTVNGTASTTCDEEDFNERTGCLVASANIIASKSEEAFMMYQIAIKSWGEPICTTILETLANRAVGGDFNTTYKKWKKAVADYDKEQRTCKVCHKVYGTVNEARECEKVHRQRKVDKLNRYLERKHAMRMAKERLEKERKEQLVKDAMDKLTSEDKDNK